MPSQFPYRHSRRSFLGLSLVSLSGILFPSCTSIRLETPPSQDLPSSFKRVTSDHPLTHLQLRNQGLISADMRVGSIETNVLFSEGPETWHQKGTQPYQYLFPQTAETEDFDPSELDVQRLKAPPLGIRSAAALGGFGTGSITLRSDGSLTDWHIFNHSPGNGNSKIQIPNAFLAIRTHKPEQPAHTLAIRSAQGASELPGIRTIARSGGFPTTILHLSDPNLPLAAEVYTYGSLDLHDPVSAAVPALVFSVVMSNPTSSPIDTSLMFMMPNIIEGTFRSENGLILSRRGDNALSGELCMAFAAGSASSSMVSPELKTIWDTFSESGHFHKENAIGIFEYGAISSQFVVEPGASRTASIILSWHFPNRLIAGESVGNFYTTQFSSSRDVHKHMDQQLPAIWTSMHNWQKLCLRNTLPSPIQDALANSLSLLYKTTFSTSDGRWRHWDSFANPGISSIDQLMFRVFPLLFFAPDVLKNQLSAFATHQYSNGRLIHALGMGERYPLDSKEGASLTTQTPLFFILVYLYYSYTNDAHFLQDIWPHIDKAIDWQLSITTPEGLPSNLPQLGDWEAMDTEGIYLEDALFHLAGLDASIRMAKVLKLSDKASTLQKIVNTGIKALNTLFWTENHYRTRSTDTALQQTDTHNKVLIGFLLPILAGIQIAPLAHISQHLDYETSHKNTNFPAHIMQWAALQILTNEDTKPGLNKIAEHLTYQRDTIKDAWGYYEQLTDNGLPWANPNHTSHLSIWFIPIAMSGQQFEAPKGLLRFNPHAPENSILPFFTPYAHGLLTIHKGERYTLEIISGKLILEELQIGTSIKYRDIVLETGQSLLLNG